MMAISSLYLFTEDLDVRPDGSGIDQIEIDRHSSPVRLKDEIVHGMLPMFLDRVHRHRGSGIFLMELLIEHSHRQLGIGEAIL